MVFQADAVMTFSLADDKECSLFPRSCQGTNVYKSQKLDKLADALERAERQLAETAANEAELRRCLTCALGVVVEFGDLNGFRNTTDQELGKLVIVVAEESATTLNCPASAAAKRYEAMEAALQAAEEALTDMDMNHGGAGKALLMVRAALDRSTAPVCKESLHGEPDATPPAASD